MMINHFLAGLILTGTIVALISDDSISGPARVIDGDTIEVAHKRIRLWGIDAPESSQTCQAYNEVYFCGQSATCHMQRLIGNEPVTCTPRDRDRYGRTVAQCSTMGGDLGRRMVAAGMAIDYTHYSKGYYKDEQDAAKAEHLGMWAGAFQPPAQYRAQHKK